MPKKKYIISTSLEKKSAKAEAIGEETTLQRLSTLLSPEIAMRERGCSWRRIELSKGSKISEVWSYNRLKGRGGEKRPRKELYKA